MKPAATYSNQADGKLQAGSFFAMYYKMVPESLGKRSK